MSGSTRQGDDRLGFYDQLLHDERRHQFYSRALGWVMFVSMVAIVVLGVVAAGQRAPADPECRAASAALPPAIEPMQLELERDALRVRRLLRGPDEIRYPTPPAYSEAICVEARAGRHRDLLGLDSAVFIPLYLVRRRLGAPWSRAIGAARLAARLGGPAGGCRMAGCGREQGGAGRAGLRAGRCAPHG
jgi:hypothetical protein